MSTKRSAAVLHQLWVHSHEEDTAAEQVFRPASYNFPRSRGRASFELKPDGSLIDSGSGPTDRRQATCGTWKIEDSDTLVLCVESPTKPKRRLHIVSVDRQRLVIKK